MALSCYWPNKFITVPKSELTLISGTRYQITVNYWWQLLRELAETVEGIVFDTPYNSTAATSSTPQIVDLINGYTAEFEDGLYSVDVIGGNTNWREIEVKNQVSVGTNNTTGFIDPIFLEASLFPGGVVLDIINGVAGIDKTPQGGVIGTRQTPSSNLADTLTIAQIRGLRTIIVVNSMTFAAEDLSLGYTISGDSPYVVVTLDPSANMTNTLFITVTLQGEIDGVNVVRDSLILDVTGVSGVFHNCAFGGAMTLNGDTDMFDCYSRVEGGGYPTFTVGDNNVVARDHKGSFGLLGSVGGHLSSIGVYGGRFIAENTCSGGEVHVRGEPFEIIDNSGAGCEVINETSSPWRSLLSDYDEPGSFGKEVGNLRYLEHFIYVDTELAINGDGSQYAPFNNVTDAIDFAEAGNIKKLVVLSDLTIDRQIKNFVIIGIGTPLIDCNGQNLEGSEITHCTVTGAYIGSLIIQQSSIEGTTTLNGFFENCALSGDLVLLPGGDAFVKNCSAFVKGTTLPTFDVAGVTGTANLIITGYDGGIKIINVNRPTDDVKIIMGVGRAILDASCTDGSINIGGMVHLIDNSTGTAITKEIIDPHKVMDTYRSAFNKRIWNKIDTLTLYADDGVTPLQVFDTDSELSTITPQ